MKFKNDCKRFQRLSHARDERELKASEEEFLARHLETCDACDSYAASFSASLNLLRDSVLEPEVSPGFDERVVRLVRVQKKRESLSYWSPAIMGAGIACIAIFAALQVAGLQSQLKPATLPDGEAKRNINADQRFPSLELKDKPRLLQ